MKPKRNPNIDSSTVASFGDEWEEFDQSGMSDAELREMFDFYFDVFPWDTLPDDAVGFDMGCGSGRWAKFVAPRVGTLHCLDGSERALEVARKTLADNSNTIMHHAYTDDIPLPDDSQDFGYSLGVLHHIPDTLKALADCVKKVRVGAPFLLYLYYDFENRPGWYRLVWRLSEILRGGISRLPEGLKSRVTDLIALLVYWPLARFSALCERIGLNAQHIPLHSYRSSSFYMMRTDARDRFGTPLEQRFSRTEIKSMMEAAGLSDIVFSNTIPFWCACGIRVR